MNDFEEQFESITDLKQWKNNLIKKMILGIFLILIVINIVAIVVGNLFLN